MLSKIKYFKSYNDYELNELNYEEALKKDKRTFWQLYVSFLKISEAFSDTIYVLFLHISGDSLYKSNQYFYLILEILSIIIITFGTLMYNEMVYINKWDLNTNLRKELEIKEKLEREEDNITKYNSINEDD